MASADDPRERWLDGGGPGYEVLPEPVALEETIALHPAAPADLPPDWGGGLGDGDGD